MKFLENPSAIQTQWDVYRQLELVSEVVPNPIDHKNPLASGLNLVWRPLLHLLIDELIAEQRVEYLERCWDLNELGQGQQSPDNSLQRLWILMN